MFRSIQLHGNIRLVNMQKVKYTVQSGYKQYSSNAPIEGNRIQYFNVRYCRYKIKVKVKIYRYRPGVAQRVGRGIALLFHDRGTRRG